VSARALAVEALKGKLGHAFADPSRLERALTHRSAGDGAADIADNERLEFLGDRVLGLVIAEALMRADPLAAEGDLAARLNALVSREACAQVARSLDLGPALRLSGGETRTGGRDKGSILAGAMEAVIAAVYEDGGLEAARALIEAVWPADAAAVETRPKDPKTRLQEWAQGRGLPLPRYVVVDRRGSDHAPLFTIEALVQGFMPARAEGGSRKDAEKAAARAMLDREGAA
jgi:ribonuclease III